MTNPSEDLLTTTEGVDEGSATSTVEGPGSGGASSAAELTGATHPVQRPAVDVEAQPAPPVDMESEQSRAARAAEGTGQQLQAGEG